MLDIAIIGAGPAGMSAAINAAARNKDILLIGRPIKTSALYKAENVNNYLGMSNLNGKKMMKEFYSHILNMNIKFQKGKVLQILPMGKYFLINADNNFIEAGSVIIATGAAKGTVIKGEKIFLGKGVSYCATCDGMLYKNKTVVVVSDNEEGEEDALFLNELCQKVYYIPKYELDKTLSDIEILKAFPDEIIGTVKVSGIKIAETTIECDGVFIVKETTPAESLIFGLEMNDGAINVNRKMETNIKGVFAAGDCTGKPLQISKAVGEGLIAAQQAVHFLHETK